MALHPFALKLEKAIFHAQRALDALLNAKKSAESEKPAGQWWDWIDALGRKRVNTRIAGNVQLGGIALGAGEHQATVNGGGGIGSTNTKALALRADPRLRAMQNAYTKALERCVRARQAAESQGTITLPDGSIGTAPGRKGVQIPCPAAEALRKSIEQYLQRTYGDTGPRGSNSGGGGGGGF